MCVCCVWIGEKSREEGLEAAGQRVTIKKTIMMRGKTYKLPNKPSILNIIVRLQLIIIKYLVSFFKCNLGKAQHS